MSDLNFVEKSQLEKLFQMSSGYVLDFSDRTFREFIIDAVKKDVQDEKYKYGSGSKANRLRRFWQIEPNYIVSALTSEMVEYAATVHDVDQSLLAEGRKIAARLQTSTPVPDISVIAPVEDDRTFDALAKSVRNSIEANQPEVGLDRLHTFVVRYVSKVCRDHGIIVDRDKPLHSMFGEYVKYLRNAGRIESEMSERILRSCISTLEAFNHVRNEQSLAHDNKILNYDESLLIFNHVCSLIRFLQSIERIAEPINDI